MSLTQITACLICRPASPCLLLLRCIQRDHIPQMIMALSFAVPSTNKSRAHVSGCNLGNFTPISSFVCSQNILAIVQPISTCRIDSSWPPHVSHVATGSICLRCSTCLAGKNSWITLHQKTLTLGGTSMPCSAGSQPELCFRLT